MSNQKKVEAKIQQEFNALTEKLHEYIISGYDKMLQKPEFQAFVNAIKDKVENTSPQAISLDNGHYSGISFFYTSLSILGIRSTSYNLPDHFDKDIDFSVFSYGLAKTIQPCAITIFTEGVSDERYTDQYQASSIEEFLAWIEKRHGYTSEVMTSEKAYYSSHNRGRIVYHVKEDRLFGGIVYEGFIYNNNDDTSWNHITRITLHRVPLQNPPVKENLSWY